MTFLHIYCRKEDYQYILAKAGLSPSFGRIFAPISTNFPQISLQLVSLHSNPKKTRRCMDRCTTKSSNLRGKNSRVDRKEQGELTVVQVAHYGVRVNCSWVGDSTVTAQAINGHALVSCQTIVEFDHESGCRHVPAEQCRIRTLRRTNESQQVKYFLFQTHRRTFILEQGDTRLVSFSVTFCVTDQGKAKKKEQAYPAHVCWEQFAHTNQPQTNCNIRICLGTQHRISRMENIEHYWCTFPNKRPVNQTLKISAF